MTPEQIKLLDELRAHIGALAFERHALDDIGQRHLDAAEALALRLWRSIPLDARLQSEAGAPHIMTEILK